ERGRRAYVHVCGHAALPVDPRAGPHGSGELDPEVVRGLLAGGPGARHYLKTVLAFPKTGGEPPPRVVVGTCRAVGGAGAVVSEDVVVVATVIGSLIGVVHVRKEPAVRRDENVIRGRIRRAVHVPQLELRCDGPCRDDAVPDVGHPEPLERGRGPSTGRTEDRIVDPDGTSDRARGELRDIRIAVRIEGRVQRRTGVVVGRVRIA